MGMGHGLLDSAVIRALTEKVTLARPCAASLPRGLDRCYRRQLLCITPSDAAEMRHHSISAASLERCHRGRPMSSTKPSHPAECITFLFLPLCYLSLVDKATAVHRALDLLPGVITVQPQLHNGTLPAAGQLLVDDAGSILHLAQHDTPKTRASSQVLKQSSSS